MGETMKNDLTTKRCSCPPEKQAKCSDDFYMKQFRWKGVPYAPNLTRWALATLNEPLTTKTRAEELAEKVRDLIRDGKYVSAKSIAQTPIVEVDPGAILDVVLTAFYKEVEDDNVHLTDENRDRMKGCLGRFAAFVPDKRDKRGPLGSWPIVDVSV